MCLRRGRGRRPGLEVADPDQERRAAQVQRSITAAYRRGEPPSDEALRAAITYITGTGDRGATVT